MATVDISKEIIDLNRGAVNMGIDALSALNSRLAESAEQALKLAPALPEEGQKAVRNYFKRNQKGLDLLKEQVKVLLDIDPTAKDAPLKGVQVLETATENLIKQGTELRKELNGLVEKGTKELPQEAKTVVELWNRTGSECFDLCCGLVRTNFSLAKSVLGHA